MIVGWGKASIAEMTTFHYPPIVAEILQDTFPEDPYEPLGWISLVKWIFSRSGISKITNNEFVHMQSLWTILLSTEPIPGDSEIYFPGWEATITLTNTLHNPLIRTRFPCAPIQSSNSFWVISMKESSPNDHRVRYWEPQLYYPLMVAKVPHIHSQITEIQRAHKQRGIVMQRDPRSIEVGRWSGARQP